MLQSVCCLALALLLAAGAEGRSANLTADERVEKALNVFSVIKFPNDECTGSNGLNGTCYTADECSNKAGTGSGSCASGFGVCCTFTLGCGVTTSENNTYFDQTAVTSWTTDSPCRYQICPMTNVCRIRIDFTAFTIAGPVGSATAQNSVASIGPALGKCATESLTITSPGHTTPPEICGVNTGQHMFIDVTGGVCITLAINIDVVDTTTSRSWQMHSKQYECGHAMAGPTGCLQYHTGINGDIASFNFDMALTTGADLSKTIHLASQKYSVCFRREKDYCRTCFSTKFATSFGVSSSPTTTANSGAALCSGLAQTAISAYSDFIEIAGAQTGTISTTTSEFLAKTTDSNSRLCGLIFSGATTAATASATVCTHNTPFMMRVNFDDGELVTNGGTIITSEHQLADATPTSTAATLAAAAAVPHGHLGFYLTYFQEKC